MKKINSENKNKKKRSIITLYGEVENDHCGYCSNGKSCSFGFESNQLLSFDYDKLMNRGFRRSGSYFYKPVMYKTCCPQYTIRLKVEDFKLSKSQKNTLLKPQKYLTKLQENNNQSGISELNLNNINELFTVETVPAEFTQERYELYRKYQIAVHKDSPDKITPESFTRFLIESPLFPAASQLPTLQKSLPTLPLSSQFFFNSSETQQNTNLGQYSGTYHQLYRFNGVLVAVSVLDLLPTGISSVYSYYDPDYRHLELGKYTALYEISYTHYLGLSYYYMGFYIHTCQKMRYKIDYKPSQLLCPVTFTWFNFDENINSLLDKYHFLPLDLIIQQQFIEEIEERKTRLSQNTNNSTISTTTSTTHHPEFNDILQKYRPLVIEESIDPSRCGIDLGAMGGGRIFSSNDLNSRGKEIVEKYIREFLLLSGEIGYDIVFKFN